MLIRFGCRQRKRREKHCWQSGKLVGGKDGGRPKGERKTRTKGSLKKTLFMPARKSKKLLGGESARNWGIKIKKKKKGRGNL